VEAAAALDLSGDHAPTGGVDLVAQPRGRLVIGNEGVPNIVVTW
jgi:hypothetical protein